MLVDNTPQVLADPAAERGRLLVCPTYSYTYPYDVLAHLGSGPLVDVRSPGEFQQAHLPGAVNVPWGQAVAADGTFKPVEELRKLYAGVGIDGKKPIITYCRIGERSSHTWFALKKLLGYEVRNYDGSWTEYGNTVGVPIANPAGTVWGGR